MTLSNCDSVVSFLLVSSYIPYVASGTPVIIRKLLEHFESTEVTVLAWPPAPEGRLADVVPHYPLYRVPAPPSGLRGERYSRILSVPMAVAQGLRALRASGARVIVAVYPDDASLLTGYLLSQFTGLPLVSYFCDVYLESYNLGWQGSLARWLQPRVFNHSRQIAVVSGGMKSYYKSTYGIETTTIPTAINLPIPEEALPRKSDGTFRIAHCGNVNEARIRTLQILVGLFGDRQGFEIALYTPQPESFLREQGLLAKNVKRAFVNSNEELIRELQTCDLMYLPHTFSLDDVAPEEMETCFGTKTYDYLLSMRPILLHSPPGYYMNQFFVENRCGIVLEDDDEDALAQAVESVATDSERSLAISNRALRTARQFSGKEVSRKFRKIVQAAWQSDPC